MPPVSFSKDLLHKYDLVKEQGQIGLRVVKRVKSFVGKYVKLAETFSMEMKKAADAEKLKLQSMGEHDRMSSCWTACLDFFKNAETLANIHNDLFTGMSDRLLEPLERFHKQGVLKGKAMEQTAEKTFGAIDAAKVKVNKEKANATKALSILDKAAKKPGEKLDKPRQAAIKACEKYQSEVDQANSVHRQKLPEIPRLLDDMQSSEESRLQVFDQVLRAYAVTHMSFAENFAALAKILDKLSAGITPAKDLEDFVHYCVTIHGAAPDGNDPAYLSPFKYDLDRSPIDVKNGVGPSDRPSIGLFRNTLEGAMRYEKELLGMSNNNTPEIPKILEVLIAAIETQGGFQEEGIFRISCSTEARAELQKQFEVGDYTVRGLDAHIPSNLLKQWLRDLSEPLIPSALYNECIQLAQGPPAKPDALRKVVAALPTVNRRIVHRLCELIRAVQKHEDVNKMTFNNLAIVFAPAFLRNPNEAMLMQTSPQNIVQEAKYAAEFLVRLVTTPAAVIGLAGPGGMMHSSSSNLLSGTPSTSFDTPSTPEPSTSYMSSATASPTSPFSPVGFSSESKSAFSAKPPQPPLPRSKPVTTSAATARTEPTSHSNPSPARDSGSAASSPTSSSAPPPKPPRTSTNREHHRNFSSDPDAAIDNEAGDKYEDPFNPFVRKGSATAGRWPPSDDKHDSSFMPKRGSLVADEIAAVQQPASSNTNSHSRGPSRSSSYAAPASEDPSPPHHHSRLSSSEPYAPSALDRHDSKGSIEREELLQAESSSRRSSVTESRQFRSGVEGAPDLASGASSPVSASGEGSKKCVGCGQSVGGGRKAVQCSLGLFHLECFKCGECNEQITGSSGLIGTDNKPYHTECAQKAANKTEESGSLCAECGERLVGKFIRAEGLKYHKQCFVCAGCRVPGSLSTGYLVRNNKPYCRPCAKALKATTTTTGTPS